MSQSKLPVCIAVAPEQLARLDQIAADQDRSRSWVASKAIERFINEFQNSGSSSPERPLVVEWAADQTATSGGEASFLPRPGKSINQDISMDTAETTRATALRGTHSLHVTHIDRIASIAADRAETDRQQRERVTQQTADYIANLGKGGV